jgi:hypothetical protein
MIDVLIFCKLLSSCKSIKLILGVHLKDWFHAGKLPNFDFQGGANNQPLILRTMRLDMDQSQWCMLQITM